MDFHNQYQIKEWTTEAAAQGLQTAEGCLEQICQATYAKYYITEEITVPQAHRPTLHIDKGLISFSFENQDTWTFFSLSLPSICYNNRYQGKNRATEAFMRN